MLTPRFAVLSLSALAVTRASNILITNDDGWATSMVRAEYEAFEEAGFDVILSAPTENKSGSGSSSEAAVPLTKPCQFSTCPFGAPAHGSDPANERINYVNAFPVDAARYGIQTLAPKYFGRKPDFVVSGTNIGRNLGIIGGLGILGSGTVGAACEASLEGVPSAAFSGDSGESVSYTTLKTDPNSTASKAARIYAELTVKFVNTLLTSTGPSLLPKTTINVNYPSISNCPTPDSFKFVLTRVALDLFAKDVETCGGTRLPLETFVSIGSGCYATVSVINAETKRDAGAVAQAVVLQRLGSLLVCRS